MVSITKENTAELSAKVKINVSTQDYQPLVESSLKSLRKKVELKGFRKGMVPVTLVKKMFGNQVLAEELNKLVDQELTKYIKDNKIEILGSPIPTESDSQPSIDVNNLRDHEFIYELGLTPEIEIDFLNDKTKVDFHKIKLESKHLQEEINRLRKQTGKMSNPVDGVQKDDVIYVELVELDGNGMVKEGGITNSTAIPVDMFNDENLVKQILKLKLEESLELDLFTSFNKERNEIGKHFLNLDEASEVSDRFRMTLRKINRVEPAEINQEFFDKVFSPGKVSNEEEFRKMLSEELEKIYDRESESLLQSQIVKELIEKAEVKLPDEFLKKWIQKTNEKPITKEQIEKEYEVFSRSLRWNLIVNKIKKEHNIEVKEEELSNYTKKVILRQFGGNELSLDEEQLDAWTKNMLENKEHVKKTYDYLLGEKLFKLIKDRIAINTKEVTIEEFKKLNLPLNES